jgi:hypothetical protein
VTAHPPAANLIRTQSGLIHLDEIEYNDFTIYGVQGVFPRGAQMRLIDPRTGHSRGHINLSLPAPEDALTALEFVDDTMYAGLTRGSATRESFLATIDLVSGEVELVGSMGIGEFLGGLAYEESTGTMYGVTSANLQAGSFPGSSHIFSVDLSTGATSTPIEVTVAGSSVELDALEFGRSGELYAIPRRAAHPSVPPSPLAGHLLTIDPLTGQAIDLGYLGDDKFMGLTAIPAPATIMVLLPILGRRKRQ